jgi:Family of unknown function (DUF6959)
MSDEVELLSLPINFAVVQLPGRHLPGVVVQGDTLHSIVKRLAQFIELVRSGEVNEAIEGLEYQREVLAEALVHYESVCAARGISLPYPR